MDDDGNDNVLSECITAPTAVSSAEQCNICYLAKSSIIYNIKHSKMQLKTCKMSHKNDLELRCVRSRQWECECVYVHKVYIDEVDIPTRKPPANEQAINMFSSKNTCTCKFIKKTNEYNILRITRRLVLHLVPKNAPGLTCCNLAKT